MSVRFRPTECYHEFSGNPGVCCRCGICTDPNCMAEICKEYRRGRAGGEGPTPLDTARAMDPQRRMEIVYDMAQAGLIEESDIKTLLQLPPMKDARLPMTGLSAQLQEAEKYKYPYQLPPFIPIDPSIMASLRKYYDEPIKPKTECTCYTLLNGHLPGCNWGKNGN